MAVAGRPSTHCGADAGEGVDAGPEPLPWLGPGARHDDVATAKSPAHYVSACGACPGRVPYSIAEAQLAAHDGEQTTRLSGLCTFARWTFHNGGYLIRCEAPRVSGGISVRGGGCRPRRKPQRQGAITRGERHEPTLLPGLIRG